MGLAAFNRSRRIKAEKEKASTKTEVNEELQLLRDKGKELGIPRASQMGEAKLLEAIAAKETELAELAEAELLNLRERATELEIENVEEKDAETLIAEIEAKEAELAGSKEEE